MAQDKDIRISNTERDAAVATLGEHLSTGRLDFSEYEERCGRAVAARTRGELEDLFGDLPAPHPDLSSATRPAQLMQRAGQLVTNPTSKQKNLVETRASAVISVIGGFWVLIGVPAAILLTVFLGAWWTFIIVGVGIVAAGAISESLKKPKT